MVLCIKFPFNNLYNVINRQCNNTNSLNWYTQPLITCSQHIILIHTIPSLHAHNLLYSYTQSSHYMHNCTKHYIDTHSPLITCTQHIILKRPVLSLHAHNTLYWYTQSSHYMHITHYIYTPSPLITCTQHIILIHTILSLHTHNTLYWYTQYPHYKHTTLYIDIYLHTTHNTDTHNTFITCTHSPLIAPRYCTISIRTVLSLHLHTAVLY